MTQPSYPSRLFGQCALSLAIGMAGCASHRELTADKSPAKSPSRKATPADLARHRDQTAEAVAAKAEELRRASAVSRKPIIADNTDNTDAAPARRVAAVSPPKSRGRDDSAIAAVHAAPVAESGEIERVEHVAPAEESNVGSPTTRDLVAASDEPANSVDPIPDEPQPGVTNSAGAETATPEMTAADTVVPAADEAAAPRLAEPSEPVADPVEPGDPEPGFVQAESDPEFKETGDRPRLSDRLKIPQELPGAAVPPLRLPKYDNNDAAARDAAIEGLFPELPRAEQVPVGEQPPMKLEDFEQLALSNNPKVSQAVASVQTATGNAVQAGLYPNPTVGYQADTVGSGGTANYHGVFVQQTIVTANKLGLARASAMFEIYNAQLRLQRTRIEVLSDVRTAYYDLLTARETVRIYEALVRFTDQAYRVQVEQLKGGQAAAYEPMQLRAQSRIARTALTMARNRYDAAARQLAAAVSMPEMRPAELADVADAAVPQIDYQMAVDHMLTVHPDLGAANNSTIQAQTNVERARVVPIPNVGFYSAIQKDFTDPTHRRTTWNMQVGVPIPLFDRNQGAIRAAEGDYIRATYEQTRVRNDLIKLLADAFRQYSNANTLVETYRNEIIPDQSRVYRAVYERHQQEPDVVGFGDIVVAQQTLQQSITAYADALGQRWAALVEIEQLLQIEDGTQLVPLLGEPMPAVDEGVPAPAPQP